ncbi:MAG TPA: CbiM family transporter, partial [Gemmataceae bacterium]|nr:CbiM family transporter [Gemmataceae bacterium]
MLPVFAVHISDGVLTPAFWGTGLVLAAVVVAMSAYRVAEDEIPRIALLTAAFFVASSIHVKVPPTSVHLLLNALVGIVLGCRSPFAVAVGLTLQVWLLGHGGYLSLGVNTLVIAAPALLARPLYRGLETLCRRPAAAGYATGFLVVVLTALLNAAALIVGGIEDWTILAAPVFLAYGPLGLIEGLIVGTIVAYLARVKPDLLGGVNLASRAREGSGSEVVPEPD